MESPPIPTLGVDLHFYAKPQVSLTAPNRDHFA